MAATDKPYRNQTVLDIIFGASCGLLLLTTLWMFWQDFDRDFKNVQRTFRDVEATLAERDMVDRLPDPDAVTERRLALRDARRRLEKVRASVASTERDLIAQREKADDTYRTIKADYDAQTSYYNIPVDDASKATHPARARSFQREAEDIKKELADLEKRLAVAKKRLDGIDEQLKTDVRSKVEEAEREYAQADDQMKKVAGTFDRFGKLAAQKDWGFG